MTYVYNTVINNLMTNIDRIKYTLANNHNAIQFAAYTNAKY